MLAEGHKLPDADLLEKGSDGIQHVHLRDRLQGRRVVIFAVPGAFTPTCSSAHLPSFIRTAGAFRAKGVDDIICISVNDPHVMQVWGQQTGAAEAGISMLADAGSAYTSAIGMDYSTPERGMLNRSRRYAMLVENGVVTRLHLEASPGACEISGGEALLAAI